MRRVLAFLGVLSGNVDAYPDSVDFSRFESLFHEGSAGIGCLMGHEIRRNASRPLGESIRKGLERRPGIGPERFVGTHLEEWRDGSILEGRRER